MARESKLRCTPRVPKSRCLVLVGASTGTEPSFSLPLMQQVVSPASSASSPPPAPPSPHRRSGLAARLRAAGLHLVLSLLVAAVAAALVFGVWYPTPYREISGGRELFLLVIAVDVVIGPLITFAIFDRRKPRAELSRDLVVVCLLQVAALSYGLYTVFVARPAVVALESDRLRVVTAIDLRDADLAKAPPGLQSLRWSGVHHVATRPATNAEKVDAVMRALEGRDVGMRPEFWRPASETAAAYGLGAKPIQTLIQRVPPPAAALLRQAVADSGRSVEQLGFLPMLARRSDWVALVDRSSGEIVGYAPVDGF